MTLSETTSFNDQEHAEDLIKELIEDGHDKDEMQEFIAVSYTHLTLPTNREV